MTVIVITPRKADPREQLVLPSCSMSPPGLPRYHVRSRPGAPRAEQWILLPPGREGGGTGAAASGPPPAPRTRRQLALGCRHFGFRDRHPTPRSHPQSFTGRSCPRSRNFRCARPFDSVLSPHVPVISKPGYAPPARSRRPGHWPLRLPTAPGSNRPKSSPLGGNYRRERKNAPRPRL